LLVVALALLVVGVIGLVVHVAQGRPYEVRTFAALAFRIFVTVLFYLAARYFRRRNDATRREIVDP
jgi:hypothetical protein